MIIDIREANEQFISNGFLNDHVTRVYAVEKFWPGSESGLKNFTWLCPIYSRNSMAQTLWLVYLSDYSLYLGSYSSVYTETNPEWLELPLAGTNFHGAKPA